MKNIYIVLRISLLTIMSLFYSCDLDQIENKYKDYNSAKMEGFFDKGWIPSEIIFTSMTDIYQRTNIDLNTCVFSYNLLGADIEKLVSKIQPIQTTYKKPSRIYVPNWWKNKVTTLKHYFIFDNKIQDTIYIAIDEQNNKIFGWY